MGRYINPGKEEFLKLTNNNIFVDKSMIINQLNKSVNVEDCYICVSRPRRFGKTSVEKLMCAYYSIGCDSRDIFENLKIAQTDNYDKYLNKLNVLRIDCNNFSGNVHKEGAESFVSKINSSVKEDFVISFPEVDFGKCDDIADCIWTAYQKTKVPFVIIIDEYDIEVRMKQKEPLHQDYLDFLVRLFKNSTISSAIALAYITGILPVVKDKFQSKLNNFQQKSMLRPALYEEFFGFTKSEVMELCNQYSIDYNTCEHWYDGYKLKDASIFNPYSIVQAVTTREFCSYWSATGSYEAISTYITLNYEGMKDDIVAMLSGQKIGVKVEKFRNSLDTIKSKDDVFTYLIHLGYLAYDFDNRQCYIPNKEVGEEWVYAMEELPEFSNVVRFINSSEKLLSQTINGDSEAVARSIKDTHELISSNLSFNNEQAYQSAIMLAYFYARSKYSMFCELPTGKGYADVVLVPYVPNTPAIIIELKRNSTKETALNQIKSKEYSAHLSHYHGDMLFVGINYDEASKEHSCKIERIAK